jgi:hypothetical protein
MDVVPKHKDIFAHYLQLVLIKRETLFEAASDLHCLVAETSAIGKVEWFGRSWQDEFFCFLWGDYTCWAPERFEYLKKIIENSVFYILIYRKP